MNTNFVGIVGAAVMALGLTACNDEDYAGSVSDTGIEEESYALDLESEPEEEKEEHEQAAVVPQPTVEFEDNEEGD